MNRRPLSAITILRWTVALVVILESCRFIFSAGTEHALRKMGLPLFTAPVLGGVEILAAVLFLVPKLVRVGGYLLLAVFTVAILLHVLHGQIDLGALLVYAAAVWTCIVTADGERNTV